MLGVNTTFEVTRMPRTEVTIETVVVYHSSSAVVPAAEALASTLEGELQFAVAGGITVYVTNIAVATQPPPPNASTAAPQLGLFVVPSTGGALARGPCLATMLMSL